MTDFLLKSDATDWSQASSWEGGVVPSSGVTNRVIIGESGPPVTDGLGQSAVAINQIVRLPGVRKAIGGNGTSLQIDVDAGTRPRVIDRGGGAEGHGLSINGALPELDVAGQAAVYVTGGAVAGTIMLIGPGGFVMVGGGATFGASANGGIVHNFGGVLDARAHGGGTDRLGAYLGAGGSLTTRRDVEKPTLAEGGAARFFESATVTDGAGGGEIKMLSRRAVLEMANDRSVTIDKLEAVLGRLETSRLRGNLTITSGNLNRSGFSMPTAIVGGTIDTSGMTVLGADGPQESI